MSNPVIDSNVRTYRFKRKKYPFFMNTDASICLKFITKQKNVPEPIVNLVRELIEFNSSKEFKSLRDVYEQDFHAHVLATISSGSIIKSTMAKGYMMQTNEILNGTLGKQGKKNEDDEDAMQENFNIDSNQMHSDDEFTERSPTRKNNLKGN
ncbi:10550_t:CDS:2 [Funneliformis caledonium]|uniref:10550_t:CDS:1 n=1 Tax=Funneliformis caledonium TaxID=1117310 RepID=A0A9N9HJ23_9GLOM|nr:10550_t:CDS:2 [Funneliformis caledonium]